MTFLESRRLWGIVGAFEKEASSFLRATGASSLAGVYAQMQAKLPLLCAEASDECEHNGIKYGQPEWKHLTRWALHNLKGAGLADCVDEEGTAWLTTIGRPGGPTPEEAEQRAAELFARTRRSADRAESHKKAARTVLGRVCARCGHTYLADAIDGTFCPPPCGGWLRTLRVDPTAIAPGNLGNRKTGTRGLPVAERTQSESPAEVASGSKNQGGFREAMDDRKVSPTDDPAESGRDDVVETTDKNKGGESS